MTIRTSRPPLDGETTTLLRPRFDGSNIGSWIGFRHINGLVAEAVLDHFRTVGFSTRSLYEDYGLCLEVVDLDTRINTSLHLDDLVEAVVRPGPPDDPAELGFSVSLSVRAGDRPRKVASSKVRVLLRRDGSGELAAVAPADLLPLPVSRIARTEPDATQGLPERYVPGATDGDRVLAELRRADAFVWRWRVSYPYCHFTERVPMSGYLRQMEEVVDRFLTDRGVSIKHLLDNRRWIPVVPHSRIAVLDEAVMEEDACTVFTVTDIFKSFTFTAQMDSYVLRNGVPLRTATGRITHGYAQIENRREFHLVEFDEWTLTALRGGSHAN